MKLKSTKISQSQHKTIQHLLGEFNIEAQKPKNFKVEGCCEVNLAGFQDTQNTVIVEIDKEIHKVQCEGKRCDFIVGVKTKGILIEVKKSPMTITGIRQLENTQNWLRNQGIDSSNQILLAIAKDIPKTLRDPMKKKKIKHIKHGMCVFERVKKEVV